MHSTKSSAFLDAFHKPKTGKNCTFHIKPLRLVYTQSYLWDLRSKNCQLQKDFQFSQVALFRTSHTRAHSFLQRDASRHFLVVNIVIFKSQFLFAMNKVSDTHTRRFLSVWWRGYKNGQWGGKSRLTFFFVVEKKINSRTCTHKKKLGT